MDAKTTENTPAIAFRLYHEDTYVYTCVCMYNMHILDRITLQVSRNVHILIRETLSHIIMEWMPDMTRKTPTIPL